MPFSTYPQEIFEEIVSHPPNDIPSLKSCALVSHFFYSIAFQLLFAAVEFHPDPSHRRDIPPPQFECFYKLLQESPRAERISSAVKVLKISNGRPLFFACEWDTYPNWVSKEPDRIGYFLRMMQNLKSLSIMQYGFTREQSPPPIPETLLRDIEHIIINGRLTSLLLRGVSIRMNSLAYCSATLQDLSIGYLSAQQVSPVYSDDPLPLPLHHSSMAQIKTLSYTQYGRELLELMRTISNSRSHSLSLSELQHIAITRTASALDLNALEIMLSQVTRGPIETLNIELEWNKSMSNVLSPKALSRVKHLILRSRLPLNLTATIKNIQSDAIIQTMQLRFWLNSPRKMFSIDQVEAFEAELLQLTVRVQTLENIMIRVEVSAGRSGTSFSSEEIFGKEREIIGKFTALIGHPLIKFEYGRSS
ncbi:hypothetical protein BDQ17DRAFT_1545434 [Cyathus striatus]|nr:hypothetical protein BDQ17DRAFT_1545434 [Cyathus striatus]